MENGDMTSYTLRTSRTEFGWRVRTFRDETEKLSNSTRLELEGIFNGLYMWDDAVEQGGFSGGDSNKEHAWVIESEDGGNKIRYGDVVLLRGISTGRYL
jgi:hypothetical protein